MSDTTFCNSPNCPIKGVENAIFEIKRQHEKFAEKQDAILIILSEQKAMSVEIFNLKKSLDEFKDDIKSNLEDNKDTHINIYDKINHLEQNKADKSESSRTISWLWGGAILVISVLINIIADHFFKGK